jgi:hypothetical protein
MLTARRCPGCLTPTAKPAHRLCPTCYSWHTFGRPPKPTAPDRYQLERLVARLARRVATIEDALAFVELIQ